ncbi:MAG: RagB/SusD family nutrient uptake outer membrane protein [Bacteroidetes bacterium]|nr:RagB/SusD family nutrient uptake outer membrane protein [Bacteroidota bacterium]
MKKHIYKKLAFGLAFLIVLNTSCKKINSYLDKAESGGTTEDQVFNSYVQAQGFLANVYSAGLGTGDWFAGNNAFTWTAATDDARCQYNYAYAPIVYTNGSLSPTNNPIDAWGKYYQAIRKANDFLGHIDVVPTNNDPNEEDGKKRMKGEAYFLRAYYYAELYKRYGRVPIIDHVQSIDDNLNIPRGTDEQTVAFITKNCDSAAMLLPVTYPANNLGRATKGAAMMLKARTLLFAASPLHNVSGDGQKWKDAAAAARAVMDLGVYHLADNYKTMLHTRESTEIIFQNTVNQVFKVATDDWVRVQQPPGQGGGWANTQPLQNLVDEYEMKNGLMITDPASGYDPQNPYKNRDPRMAMTVIYNGAPWAGTTIYSYVGSGTNGLNFKPGSTQTGYYMGGKMLDETSTLITSYQPGSHYWVYMRYAETLLDYAEAQNEAVGPDQSVYDAINAIRGRTGVAMPPLPAGLTKDQMRDRIRHERRVEMALEDSRFWDIRRWKIGMQVMTAAYGMRATKTGSTYSYQPFLVENRVYKEAYDLWPILQTELLKNKSLVQNEGY